MVSQDDRSAFEKVRRISSMKGYTTYLDMAMLIDKSESFIKQVASGRAKFNLDHLRKFALELECDVKEFL